MEYWGVNYIPRSVFLFTIYHYSQGYKAVKEMFPQYNIWEKLDIFISYIEQLNLVMDMVNLSASSRTIYPLMVRFAKHGFIDCIEFCLSLFESDKRETKYLLNSEIYIFTLESNLKPNEKIKAMEKLKTLGFPVCHTSRIINKVNPETFIWLYENGAPVDSSTLKEAITTGLEDTIRFILDVVRVPLTEELMEHACYENNIFAVKMFIKRGCPCNYNSFLRAIENSNIDMITMLLHYIPCEATEELIEKSFEIGNLECLEYLISNGVRVGKGVLQMIKDEGSNNEACLQYLIKNYKLSLN